jgi:hypothetical protein
MIFNEKIYYTQLLEDLCLLFKEYIAIREGLRNDFEKISSHLYKNFYKRKYLYEVELQKIEKMNLEDFFRSLPNHDLKPFNERERKFSFEWTPESESDPLGRIIVKKRNGYERKQLLPGTYLKQDLLTNLINEKQIIQVSIPDRWNFEDNENINNDIYTHFYGEIIRDEYLETKNQVRLYFNFNPSSTDFLNHLSIFADSFFLKLNRRKIPFHIKICKNTQLYFADNVVLYLERRYLLPLLDILEENYPRFADSLQETTPMFTYPLKKGVGFAEGIDANSSDDSFGQNIVKEILKCIIESKIETCEEVVSKDIVKLLGRKQNFLFLNKNSNFHYEYHIISPEGVAPPETKEKGDLDVCIRFGYWLCTQAIWDSKERCNWIGYSDESSYTSLSISYLDGLSGILLYLVELFKVTKKPYFKRHAIGVIKTILAKSNFSVFKYDEYPIWGFHGGMISIFYVMQKAINTFQFEEKDIFQKELDILMQKDNFIVNSNDDLPLDVYGGVAGTLWGLLLLKKERKSNVYDSKIKELRDYLINKQDWQTDDYVKTKYSLIKNELLLAGFPHGISGISYVLLLYSYTFLDFNNNIIDRVLSTVSQENGIRRIKDNLGIQEDIWLGLRAISTVPPPHWENGACEVSYARMGLHSLLKDPSLLNAIKTEFNYCCKRATKPIDSIIPKMENGIVDFLISCIQYSFIRPEEIHTLLKPFLEKFESDTLDFTNIEGKSINHPGLIGSAGCGLSLLRLYDPQAVNSYILPL